MKPVLLKLSGIILLQGVSVPLFAAGASSAEQALPYLAVTPDTLIDFIVMPVTASAEIIGEVTLANFDDISKNTPMEGCTVTVSRADPQPVAASTSIIASGAPLRAVTDENGRFTIKVPITVNGETWLVRAFKDAYAETQKLELYNGQRLAVNFNLSGMWDNCHYWVTEDIVYTMATDKFVYQEKDSVRIRYALINHTRWADFVFGPFRKGCEYDLQVMYVSGGVEKTLYHASDFQTCLGVEDSIPINAGQTEVHDFPAYYVSDIRQYVTTTSSPAGPLTVTLIVAARLQGDKYNYTEFEIPITVELTPALSAAVSVRQSGSSGASFDARTGRFTLELAREQKISVTCYSLDGTLIGGSPISKRMPAGMHTLSLRTAPTAGGLYIIDVKGADFGKRFTTMSISR